MTSPRDTAVKVRSDLDHARGCLVYIAIQDSKDIASNSMYPLFDTSCLV